MNTVVRTIIFIAVLCAAGWLVWQYYPLQVAEPTATPTAETAPAPAETPPPAETAPEPMAEPAEEAAPAMPAPEAPAEPAP